ncbi:MAG: hypothetical protein JXA21_00405 [Anaerolineae bacterium]|nr:hypothetical protein [Anaerolineae bacterium]
MGLKIHAAPMTATALRCILSPFFSELVAVPPGAIPTLRVVLVEETDRPLPGPLALAPYPQGVQRDAAGHLIGGKFAPALSVQTALSATPAKSVSPAQSDEGEPVVLEPAGVVRGVRLARLVFYPARPIGTYPQARLRVTTHVRVSLTFAGQPGDLPRAASPDPLLAALRSAVINPDQVQPSMVTIQNPLAELASKPSLNDAGSAWTALEVSTPGLTAIMYQALAESGFPVGGVDPHTLHLAHALSANEIAAEWDGNENAIFEPGERLLFYAEPRFSRWTSTDVYLLWQAVITPGLRMQNRPAVPAGQPLGTAWADETVEINQLYTPDCFCGTLPPGRDGDRWTWDDLKRPGHATASYSINLPTVDATQPATLSLWLIGYTDISAVTPDHRVEAALNNVLVGNVEWDGRQAITATLPIPPGLLSNTNTITLTLPGMPGVGIEGAWLDAFSIRYARGSAPFGHSVIFTGQPTAHAYTLAISSTLGLRAYDVTNPDRPLRLTGVITGGYTISLSDPLVGGSHRYALTTDSGLLFPVAASGPAQALQTTGGADYVMIAPTDFIPALSNLITLRRSQGLTVAVENVQAIYDAYGDGRPDPAAIRAYLAHAYAAWMPRPTYVLLVGAGSFDPRRYRADSPPTFIPPYLADIDPWAGETAADNRYVAVDEVDGVDSLPDMLIGRLPVKTLTETQTVVDKIVQYETKPFPGGWNENVTFVADNADEAGDFAAASEVIAAAYVTAPFTPQRIYFTPPATTITTTRQAVLKHWNAGALIIQYTGHSSWQQWAAERFLHLDDLSALRNERRWPIVIEMTCFTGAFQRPEPTLDAGLLTLNSGGVVAAWGATGLGIGTGHSSLGDGFFRAVFSDTVSTLGQATLAEKLSLAAAGQNLDLLDTFTLLGDPALRLDRTIIPWASRTYLPIVSRN